ncbi:MAG: carboxyl transferase domain-containing protein [Candidatus Binatia bacterium]
MSGVSAIGQSRFSALRARQRAEALLDSGTFRPLPDACSDAPLLAGTGSIGGAPVLVALTDGRVRGGTIGVRESGVLARIAESAQRGDVEGQRPLALILGFDTGGVRVEEGPIALAAASAVGVALARLSLSGVHLAAVISGPRGCFGAPAVMAALPERIIITADAQWGLTGPKLLGPAREEEGLAATSPLTRVTSGDAHVLVPDDIAAVRAQVRGFVCEIIASDPPAAVPFEDRLALSAATAESVRSRLRGAADRPPQAAVEPRRRDLLSYSLRGMWTPSGPIRREGLVHAAFGTLRDRDGLGFIVGPERAGSSGVGIEETAVVTDMVRLAAARSGGEPASILTFLFCQGHAVDFVQERLGLQRCLAECLRAMVAARLRGHPIVTILGGGTYGAAYLALAAPSHRILALRGTSVAPMSPQVLRAFQALRGQKVRQEAGAQLAELIPDIRMVDNIVRLPRVLAEELTTLLATVRPEQRAA